MPFERVEDAAAFLEEILKGNHEPFCFELVYDEKDELISALKLEVEEE